MKALTILDQQEKAKDFVSNYLSTNPLGLSDLKGDKFEFAMTQIMQGMLAAWVNGFLTGNKGGD